MMNKAELQRRAGIIQEDLKTQMNVATIVKLIRDINDRNALQHIQQALVEKMDSISSR